MEFVAASKGGWVLWFLCKGVLKVIVTHSLPLQDQTLSSKYHNILSIKRGTDIMKSSRDIEKALLSILDGKPPSYHVNVCW